MTMRQNKGGKILTDGNKQFWKRDVIPQALTDFNITLDAKYDQNPDLLSEDLYGTTKLEWLILQFNNIIDPWTEFRTGSTIRLMVKTRALEYL